MGFPSQSGQVGFGFQGSKGSRAVATRFVRLMGGSLGGDRNLLIPDAEIGGNRDIPFAYLGPVAFNGDYTFYARFEAIAFALKAALGSSADSAAASANEAQLLTGTGTATGGTFTLTFRGITTAPIAYNATAAVIATALVAAGTASGVIVSGDIVGTGGPLPATPVTLTFAQQYVGINTPLITANVTALTGTTPGVAVTTTTQGLPPIGTHIITPIDLIPWISVEERISNQFESYAYTDGKVNNLKLSCDASGYFIGDMNLSALSQLAGFTSQTNPKFDATPAVVGTQVAVTFNGVTLPLKTFSLEIMNNLELDDFVLGSVIRDTITEKRREIKMTGTFRPADSNLWRSAMYGSSAATAAASGPGFSGPATITVTSFETIGAVISGTPFSLSVAIPSAIIAPFKITPNKDDVISNDIQVTLVRPDNVVPIMTATVVNDLATVS